MKINGKNIHNNITAYLFLAPFLIVFSLFLAYPVIYSLVLSLHKVSWTTNLYNIFSDMKFVGFDNYIKLFHDSRFWWSLIVTGYYGILTIPLTVFLGLILAILLNNKLPGVSLFRSAYFLPSVLDILVVGIIWTLIYSPHFGILPKILDSLGFSAFMDKGILANPRTALPGVAIAMVLRGAGFGMILFLSAIQNIPVSVYEAAEIDGANAWQKLIYITIPLVKPIILFLVIMGTIGSLNAFTEIYSMTQGGPYVVEFMGNIQGATRVSGYYLFEKWETMEYGYAAAVSYVLLFITLGISLVNAKMMRKKN
ncbi:sugar ABC transporter permease [bacterium]|nr:sugar ABC transporter permease [bacterium]MBU3956185.1 sugar ABC transporter permease [bacterium]MDO9514174.1 sugar ABC transporter permease [Elusimicrobiota bacterium]